MDKKQPKKEKVPAFLTDGRGNAFIADFSTYLQDTKGEFKTTKEILNKRQYTVGKTNISYRNINHWGASGLLPEGVKDDGTGWRKFTFIEVVWVKILERLREFGFSIEKIAKARDTAMEWDANTDSYPIFEYYVIKAWASKADPYVVFLIDGTAEVLTSAEIEKQKVFSGSNDLLVISLKSVLKEMGRNPLKPYMLFELSDKEVDLLSEIRLEGNKEVKVKVKNGHLDEIEMTKMYPEAPPLEDINRDLKKGGAFAEVVTKYEGGKKQSAEVKTKKRWK
jgi:DNA-binding transcriptional MerR regulator